MLEILMVGVIASDRRELSLLCHCEEFGAADDEAILKSMRDCSLAFGSSQ